MDFLNPYATIDVSIIDLIRNMGIGLLMALIWKDVISRTTRLVVDTRQYLTVFILLIPSMILIITIIKSSIALSLGLVGALSIVRFRTPIKEPEELLYLFVAIAVGLGLGANQLLATIIGFAAICLGMIPAAFLNKSAKSAQSIFVDLSFPKESGGIDTDDVETTMNKLGYTYGIKRINASAGHTEILLDIVDFEMKNFSKFKAEMQALNESVRVVATENARIIT
jgi:Domain of unknown function (DUF4956)